MIIAIDGPEKAGKSTLVEWTLGGFNARVSEKVKQSGRDPQGGFGYLRPFLNQLDSPEVFVWDRNWISEVVYGQLLGQDRPFARDPFMAEWYYGRLLTGRGGKFVLLPEDISQTSSLRDEDDLDVDPLEEMLAYSNYAFRWGYRELTNNYTPARLAENGTLCRRSVFLGLHGVPSTVYVGGHSPTVTLVGEVRRDSSLTMRPFLSKAAAEFLRPFGPMAINRFGYTTIDGYKILKAKYPNLVRNPVAVGSHAQWVYRDMPPVPFDDETTSIDAVTAFATALRKHLPERIYHATYI